MPSAFTRVAQKGWSPPKGTTSVGRPAVMPAAVVPAPPWCTTALTRSNSQSCGTKPATYRFSSGGTSTPPQPVDKTARTPLSRTASRTTSSVSAMSPAFMEPKPIYTGFSPAARKSASAGSG